MSRTTQFVGAAGMLVVLGLAGAGVPSTEAMAADRMRIAMDDMKMKSDPPGNTNNSMGNMGQSGGQPQSMGGGRKDDKMKMPMPDCQGAGCQSRDSSMMQMMERMHGQMNQPMSSSGAGTGADSGAMASGPADVTERVEGRIAFLRAELQITDKQLPDWNLLADALRSSRQHLLEARKLLVMDDKMASPDRVERYEQHLGERLEAIKSARVAFKRLYGALDEGQRQTADTILMPLIAAF